MHDIHFYDDKDGISPIYNKRHQSGKSTKQNVI